MVNVRNELVHIVFVKETLQSNHFVNLIRSWKRECSISLKMMRKTILVAAIRFMVLKLAVAFELKLIILTSIFEMFSGLCLKDLKIVEISLRLDMLFVVG